MADESHPQSIAARIAALQLNQVGRQPDSALVNGPGSRKAPPALPVRPTVPARPTLHERSLSSNVPPTQAYAPVSNGGIGNLPAHADTKEVNVTVKPPMPALPSRSNGGLVASQNAPIRSPSRSPALPPRQPPEPLLTDGRRPSESGSIRRGSDDSVSSMATSQSALSRTSTSTSERVKAPAYDANSLPALPPKRTLQDKEAAYKKYNVVSAVKRPYVTPTKSSPAVPQQPVSTQPPLPNRSDVRTPSLPTQAVIVRGESVPPLISTPPEPQGTTPPPPRRAALSMGFGNPTTVSSAGTITSSNPLSHIDGDPDPPPVSHTSQPPPIPSRPDVRTLEASKPKQNSTSATSSRALAETCLLCRDYSGPDNHAAQFPRQSLPSHDIGRLAHQLTAPFPSSTDKARAIFTWLHHNVAYDTVAFFSNNVRASTPQSTLQTGLAVCEGYAGLFSAMALKAGLESQVISGHGKGYGYAALGPGSPLPPYSAGHAWNAVKIDGGQWKLIDCCWGAGVVNGKGRPYEKRFAPQRFSQPNDEFGLDHFPGDSTKQFRSDGRVLSWPEYITGNKDGCGADFFAGFVAEEGLDKTSFRPQDGKIRFAQQGLIVRFSFQKVCRHWDPVRCGNGPYFLYVLHLDALEGNPKDFVPFETTGDVWWCDVPIGDLGRPGMKAHIYAITQFNGADGRGLTIERYREMKGRCGYAFGGVCMWTQCDQADVTQKISKPPSLRSTRSAE